MPLCALQQQQQQHILVQDKKHLFECDALIYPSLVSSSSSARHFLSSAGNSSSSSGNSSGMMSSLKRLDRRGTHTSESVGMLDRVTSPWLGNFFHVMRPLITSCWHTHTRTIRKWFRNDVDISQVNKSTHFSVEELLLCRIVLVALEPGQRIQVIVEIGACIWQECLIMHNCWHWIL